MRNIDKSVSDNELELLFKHFDKDGSNGVSLDEFISGI